LASPHQALASARKKASEVRHKELSDVTTRIIVGTATCGISAGARSVVDALEQEIKELAIERAVVTETGCTGRCDLEPLVQVVRDGEPPVMYYHVDADKARRIVQQHIRNGEVIAEWALT
jgi:NADP-reducing hydrogenase subunit HndB